VVIRHPQLPCLVMASSNGRLYTRCGPTWAQPVRDPEGRSLAEAGSRATRLR
jgi:hypothetical protein